MVLGDDSWVHVTMNGQEFMLEGDFSKYDQSQGFTGSMENPMSLDHMCNMTSMLGLGDDIIRTIKQMLSIPIKFEGDDGEFVSLEYERPILPSGISVTTLFNSLTTMTIWYNVLLRTAGTNAFSTTQLKSLFADYGFAIKLNVTNTIIGSTFLKKIVLSSNKHKYQFVNLFGITTKFGLCKKSDLRVIYNGKLWKDQSYDVLIEQFLSDVANGYLSSQLNPFTKTIVDKFVKRPMSDAGKEYLYNPYKVIETDVYDQTSLIDIDWRPLYDRYGFDDLAFRQLFTSVESMKIQENLSDNCQHMLREIVEVDYNGTSTNLPIS